MRVYFLVIFYFSGVIVLNQWSYNILRKGSFGRELAVLVSFSSDQKTEEQLAPLPRPFLLEIAQ